MFKLGRKGRTALVAVAAVTGATVLVGASPSATAEGVRYGTLTLEASNGVATVTLREADGTVVDTQTFTASGKCALTAGGTLLGITAAGGQFGLGLNVNDIGVRAKNNCATDSGRVSGQEAVTVSLGAAIPADVRITRAELDIEGKKNADLTYTIGTEATTVNLPNAASDNGPDAGVNDNSRVVIDEADTGFRSITLAAGGPSDAEISLDGGGDGSFAQFDAAGLVSTEGDLLGTAATVFVLSSTFDGVLDCGDTVQARIDPDSVAPVAVEAEVHRREKDDCVAVPYTFVITDLGVLFDTPQDVAADMTILWQPETADLPITQRQINLTPANPNTWTDVVWCTQEVAPGQWGHPANTPWCLISDSTVLLPGGMVQQSQRYDGAGDPMWR